LADRAQSLQQMADESGIPFSGEQARRLADAASRMRAAGDRLRRGDGAAGLKAQRHAQRLLEMAGARGERGARNGGRQADGDSMSREAAVPKKSKDDSARAFRQRVGRGLKREAPRHLQDAVRRYAEALLK
jgi:hypothetical protein